MSGAQPPARLLVITEGISLPCSVHSGGEMGDSVGKRLPEETDIEDGSCPVRTAQCKTRRCG